MRDFGALRAEVVSTYMVCATLNPETCHPRFRTTGHRMATTEMSNPPTPNIQHILGFPPVERRRRGKNPAVQSREENPAENLLQKNHSKCSKRPSTSQAKI